jgi:hypothetical protein
MPLLKYILFVLRHPLLGIGFWFIVLFVGYGTLIQLFPPQVMVDCQEQRIKNRIRAENFLYAPGAFDCVLTGSSMTARLPDEALDERIYKLAFGGGTPIEGLEIVLRSNQLPKLVVVEVNALVTDPLDFIPEHLFNPVFERLRSYLSFMRTEYRPASVVVSALAAAHGPPPVPSGASNIKKKILGNILARAALQGGHLPEEPLFTDNLDRLEKLVQQLEASGVQVAFLYMPMHPKIAMMRGRAAVLTRTRQRFDPTRYNWLEPGKHRDFETTDGVHLNRSEARYVAEYIHREIRELLALL